MKKTDVFETLLLQVATALGEGNVAEGFIQQEGWEINGLCDERNQVTVNPAHHVVKIAIHELLHRLYPDWSENYIRNRTSFIKNRMTDEQVQLFYDQFKARARTLKKPLRLKPGE